MPASVTSPADVVNQALAALGHSGRVGNLYDGSAAAKKALDIFAETRDEVLRKKDWPFALRQVAGTGAASVVSGWAHAFAYPSDCIRLRSVAPAVIPSPNYDPQPVLWTLFNDKSVSPAIKVILTQITPVSLNYVGQVTDMALWEPLFVAAVVEALAAKLGPGLVKQIAPAIDPAGAVNDAAHADEALAPDDAAMPATMAQPQARRSA